MAVGKRWYPGLGWKMTDTPNRIQRAAPRLGEDNEYVYRQLLGLTDEEYQHHSEIGMIGTSYALPRNGEPPDR